MGKLLRNCKRHNPGAKILSGRIGIRSDLKEMMEAEAQLWGMSRAEYTNKLFQHFFCELAPLERYNALNPSRFNKMDYEDG